MKKLGHSFGRASGLSRNDCHYMAYRFEEKRGFAPDAGESWVLQSHGELRFTIMMKRGWMTSLWRSLTGQLFVTDTARRVYSPGIIASTDDGASFMGFRVDGFVQASAQELVSW